LNVLFLNEKTVLEWRAQNIVFLDTNFPYAVWVKTDNGSVDDVVAKIMDRI